MELYHSGRLPSDDLGDVKGGWRGWHDEGGHVRALSRILCAAPILGMDFGCGNLRLDLSSDHAMIHLSPYQQAPFDLHVGFEVQNGETTTRGFYARRGETIRCFLGKLEALNGQALCDLVYDSIAARFWYAKSNERRDPNLDRDLLRIRTLSAIAAGFGGKQLAAIFRCLFFDYRHYSGGLPDLHLSST